MKLKTFLILDKSFQLKQNGTSPNLHNVRILILANFYDVTADYLFGLTDEPHKN